MENISTDILANIFKYTPNEQWLVIPYVNKKWNTALKVLVEFHEELFSCTTNTVRTRKYVYSNTQIRYFSHCVIWKCVCQYTGPIQRLFITAEKYSIDDDYHIIWHGLVHTKTVPKYGDDIRPYIRPDNMEYISVCRNMISEDDSSGDDPSDIIEPFNEVSIVRRNANYNIVVGDYTPIIINLPTDNNSDVNLDDIVDVCTQYFHEDRQKIHASVIKFFAECEKLKPKPKD